MSTEAYAWAPFDRAVACGPVRFGGTRIEAAGTRPVVLIRFDTSAGQSEEARCRVSFQA